MEEVRYYHLQKQQQKQQQQQQEMAGRAAGSNGNPGISAAGFKGSHLPGAATQAAGERRIPKKIGHVQHGEKGEAGAGAGAAVAPAATLEDSAKKENGESSGQAITYVKGVPLFRGGEEHFPRWKKAFLTVAKQFNIFGALTGGVDIPVADLGKSVQRLQEEGFSAEDINTHLMAWNTLNRAIKDKGDQDILFRLTSPAAAWRELLRKYCGTTLGAKMQGTKQMLETRVSPTEDPVHALAELIDKARELRTVGLDIPEELSCVIFLVSLPPEYDAFKETIQGEKTMTFDRLVTELRAHQDRQKQDRDRLKQDRDVLKQERNRLKQDRVSEADYAPTTGTQPGIVGDHAPTVGTGPGMTGDHTLTTEMSPGMAVDHAPTTGTEPGMAGDHTPTTDTSPGMAGDHSLTTETSPGVAGDHTPTTETKPGISGGTDGETGEQPIKSQESQNRDEVLATRQESKPPALSKVTVGYPGHDLGFTPGEGYAGEGPTPTDSTVSASTLSGSSTPGPWVVNRDFNDTLYWRNNESGDTAYQLVIQPVPLTPSSTPANISGGPEADRSGSDEKKKVGKAKKGGERDGHWVENYHEVTGAKSWYHTGTKKTTTIDPFF